MGLPAARSPNGCERRNVGAINVFGEEEHAVEIIAPRSSWSAETLRSTLSLSHTATGQEATGRLDGAEELRCNLGAPCRTL